MRVKPPGFGLFCQNLVYNNLLATNPAKKGDPTLPEVPAKGKSVVKVLKQPLIAKVYSSQAGLYNPVNPADWFEANGRQ